MISLEFVKNGVPQYMQLYEYLKNEILIGRIAAGQKLPSLREATEILDVSLTTVRSAYDQLLLEGYITNKPQSGYYASELNAGNIGFVSDAAGQPPTANYDVTKLEDAEARPGYRYDLSSFDFVKWKKCMAAVLNETPEALLTEGDRQGEPELRSEISKYIFRARGVFAEPGQIVIGAGTQQLMGILSRILKELGIEAVAVEDPGYEPVRSTFRDRGFRTIPVPVMRDGIIIEELPTDERTAVYVSPSNQFPTGSVMPAGRRYQLMEWADRTGSIIIEDDYDSELRYFGRPIPPIRALRPDPGVVYLGSFSSTLFSAIRMSYMVLPRGMAEIFSAIKSQYHQTGSKSEQLTLARFMAKGYYQTHIKKVRSLYSQKLRKVVSAFETYGKNLAQPVRSSSGVSMIIRVFSDKDAGTLIREGAQAGLRLAPVSRDKTKPAGKGKTKAAGSASGSSHHDLIFYYNQIPMEDIDSAIKSLIGLWQEHI